MYRRRCDYWHFRLDADTSMKMEALTAFMKDQPYVRKVYLINQNYAHGQQVSKYAKDNRMRFKSFNGDVEMRRTDHQLQQALHRPLGKSWWQVPVRCRKHRLHLGTGQVL